MTAAPPPMSDDELRAEITSLEPMYLHPELIRRCLDLLAQVIFEQTGMGRSVGVAHFGTSSSGPGADVVFTVEP